MMGAKNYIMKAFTLTLKQVNKSGNDSFKAVKTFENFGKFVREGNESQVRRVLLKHFVFIEKYSGYSA
jgi:hypothetical protein